MDYRELAEMFMRNMVAMRKADSQKKIDSAMRGETFVLQYLSDRREDVLPSEISGEMGISTARVATALNSLENKALITRRIDTNDRRKILVTLTSEGKRAIEEHHNEILQDIASMLESLGEQDAREYVRITGKLAAYMPPK